MYFARVSRSARFPCGCLRTGLCILRFDPRRDRRSALDLDIRPLVERRFPGLTDDQIKEAHAYAYGGSVIQDLGYYPFGSKEFSDLVHYVRSGAFVDEMLKQSQTADEYAFALGAMAHYIADVTAIRQ